MAVHSLFHNSCSVKDKKKHETSLNRSALLSSTGIPYYIKIDEIEVRNYEKLVGVYRMTDM